MIFTSSKKEPEKKKCATQGCAKFVTPIKSAFGWWSPTLCAECSAEQIAERLVEETRQKRIESMRRLNLPPRFAAASLENFDGSLQPLAHATAVRYVEDYKPRKTKKGIYFFGEAGNGKTHLAAAIGNKIAPIEYAKFVTAPEILLSIKKTFNNSRSGDEMLDLWSAAPFLIIDDLGSEKPTEWVQETLFVLIDRRYTHFRPTIYTSNYSLDEIKDRLGNRIASRIAEVSQMVELRPSDYRIRKQK